MISRPRNPSASSLPILVRLVLLAERFRDTEERMGICPKFYLLKSHLQAMPQNPTLNPFHRETGLTVVHGLLEGQVASLSNFNNSIELMALETTT